MADPSQTLPRTLDTPSASRRNPMLYIALHGYAPSTPPSRHVLDDIAGVKIGRGDATAVQRTTGGWLEIRIADPRVSSQHVSLTRDLHRWAIEDPGSRNGTFVNGEAVRRALLVDGDIIEAGNTFFVFADSDARDGDPLDATANATARPGLATLLPDLERTFVRVVLAARTGESVIVHGESGTGKELVARAIHDLSGANGAFVAVNCGALPETMVEGELFGHRKGAFSGAAGERAGLVRSAHRGSLFLDEIGDLRLSSQAALLRVLQEHEVTPIGSDVAIPVELRVIAATHRSLDELVADGQFRGDLLSRLRGFVIELPPLRARRPDLGLLIAALLARQLPAEAQLPAISSAAARRLFTYAWPYNVRELEKCLSTAVVMSEGGTIRVEHLPDTVRADAPSATPIVEPATVLDAHVDQPSELVGSEPRREHLVRLLREYHGNVAAVARALGKARTQIHRWLDRYGIDPDDYRA
jgi:DNA-binding NtrC family response regulator